MNGRTCQLCGKALSRFTVGSGGDFCSREHRNQFRLRLGMDRLVEANKVASLMRRRENAKAIPASQLARDSKVLPRVAPLLRMPVRQSGCIPLLRPAAASERPKISPAFRKSAVWPSSLRPSCARRFVRSIRNRLTSRPVRPLLPPRTDRLRRSIAPAGAVAPSPGQRARGATPPRGDGTAVEFAPHPHWRQWHSECGRCVLPAQNCQETAAGAAAEQLRGPRLRTACFRRYRIPSAFAAHPFHRVRPAAYQSAGQRPPSRAA